VAAPVGGRDARLCLLRAKFDILDCLVSYDTVNCIANIVSYKTVF